MPAYSEKINPEQIAATNKTIQTLCSKRKECTYIDTQAIFLSDHSLFPDGVHPNDAGYARWIEALSAVYKQISE